MIQGLQPDELPVTPPVDVEAGIRPLVDKINQSTWLKTRQSCEGHPDRETGPWVWIQVDDYVEFERLFWWMDRVNARLGEWLVSCTYIGEWDGRWFEIRGRYLRPDMNRKIVQYLIETF